MFRFFALNFFLLILLVCCVGRSMYLAGWNVPFSLTKRLARMTGEVGLLKRVGGGGYHYSAIV